MTTCGGWRGTSNGGDGAGGRGCPGASNLGATVLGLERRDHVPRADCLVPRAVLTADSVALEKYRVLVAQLYSLNVDRVT